MENDCHTPRAFCAMAHVRERSNVVMITSQSKMADRLTQLQEAINQLADYFCNSIGVLQQTGSEQNDAESKDPSEDNVGLFSDLISRTSQDIETLIDSLPNHEYTPEKQVEGLKKLEMENSQSAERLARAVKDGEVLLERIRAALKEISDSRLGIEQPRT